MLATSNLALQATETGLLPDAAATMLLAVVQGLTEFLPVSSSGHLVLMEEALAQGEPGLVLPIALHLGTLVAVVTVYRAELAGIVRSFFTGERRDAWLIAVGTIPAGLVGVLLHDFFRERFDSGRSAAVGLLATALILYQSDRSRRAAAARAAPGPETGTQTGEAPGLPAPAGRSRLTYLDALLIGIGQAVAILPGISRSGTTIAIGMMRGVEPVHAARFSFLLSIPAILGAALLEGTGFLSLGLSGQDLALLGWGFGLSALVGWASLRVLIAFLNRGAFVWFAVYCAVLGVGYLIFV